MFYEIMHRESCVAQLSTTGECRVCLEDFMPYDLVLVFRYALSAKSGTVLGNMQRQIISIHL